MLVWWYAAQNVPEERVSEWVERCECLRSKCTAPYFLLCICLYALVQSMIVTGLVGAVLTTWERRYALTSTQSGLLPSVIDFGVLMCSFFVAHFGATGHKPRILAAGLATIGVGAFVFIIPQLYGSAYSASIPPDQVLCSVGFPALKCTDTNQDAYIFLVFGAITLAVGGTPVWTLGPTYLEEIAPASQLATYLGVLFAVGAIGV